MSKLIKTLVRNAGKLATFLTLTGLVALLIFCQYGSPPFSAVAGRSMEPTYYMGDLLIIKEISPVELRKGDIIVVQVPQAIRERFSLPPRVVHRITRIEASETALTFRMQGDNNPGEDPFTVLPGDILGTVARTIPRLGFPILFLESRQGAAFIWAAILIYLFYILSETAASGSKQLLKTAAAAFTSTCQPLQGRDPALDGTSLRGIEQSLSEFSLAMREYGEHLRSHTRAVGLLTESADRLCSSTEEQGRVAKELRHLLCHQSSPLLPSLSAQTVARDGRTPCANRPAETGPHSPLTSCQCDHVEELLSQIRRLITEVTSLCLVLESQAAARTPAEDRKVASPPQDQQPSTPETVPDSLVEDTASPAGPPSLTGSCSGPRLPSRRERKQYRRSTVL